MLIDAARALSLDLGDSAMVGDSARDMLAARAAGVGTAIRIAAADAADRNTGNPEMISASVSEAAAWFAARFAPARPAAPR
jgi:phosphoglycolate phosphatase-like HAD superfamily hydrolase